MLVITRGYHKWQHLGAQMYCNGNRIEWATEWQYKSGWWLTYPSEKYEFVSWDDHILNIWENNPVMFQENHQPEIYINSYHIGFSRTETGPRWHRFHEKRSCNLMPLRNHTCNVVSYQTKMVAINIHVHPWYIHSEMSIYRPVSSFASIIYHHFRSWTFDSLLIPSQLDHYFRSWTVNSVFCFVFHQSVLWLPWLHNSHPFIFLDIHWILP